jgi:type II secretory pathway pseudopilin PulG
MVRPALKQSSGFTFVGLLIVVALSGIALSVVGIVWHHNTQREQEKELLFTGHAYRNAITSYYESSPSGVKEFPRTLDDLLLDKRFPVIKRHIRQLYPNPITPQEPWALLLQQGQIIGVYTDSNKKPIKKSGFSTQDETFSEAADYSGWQFIYMPG